VTTTKVKPKNPAGQACLPRMFTWDVIPIPQPAISAGSCGVSEDRRRAINALLDALHGSPVGTHGVVKSATVDSLGSVSYNYGSLVAVAERGATASVTVWLR
jgi:hypothetical protein